MIEEDDDAFVTYMGLMSFKLISPLTSEFTSFPNFTICVKIYDEKIQINGLGFKIIVRVSNIIIRTLTNLDSGSYKDTLIQNKKTYII